MKVLRLKYHLLEQAGKILCASKCKMRIIIPSLQKGYEIPKDPYADIGSIMVPNLHC